MLLRLTRWTMALVTVLVVAACLRALLPARAPRDAVFWTLLLAYAVGLTIGVFLLRIPRERPDFGTSARVFLGLQVATYAFYWAVVVIRGDVFTDLAPGGAPLEGLMLMLAFFIGPALGIWVAVSHDRSLPLLAAEIFPWAAFAIPSLVQ